MNCDDIFDEGVSVKALDSVILCGQGKSQTKAIFTVQKPRENKPYLAGPTMDFGDDAGYLKKHSDFRKKMMDSDSIITFHPAQGDDMKHAPMELADKVPFVMGMSIWTGPCSNPREVKTSVETHEVHSFSEMRGISGGILTTRHWLVPKGFPRFEDSFLYNKHLKTACLLSLQFATKAALIRSKVRSRVGGMGISIVSLKNTVERFGEPTEGLRKDLEELDAVYLRIAKKVGLPGIHAKLSSEAEEAE